MVGGRQRSRCIGLRDGHATGSVSGGTAEVERSPCGPVAGRVDPRRSADGMDSRPGTDGTIPGHAVWETSRRDGTLVATNATDGDIRIWAMDNGRCLYRGHSVYDLSQKAAFLPDSKSFISVSEDWVTLIVRDAATGRELRRFDVPPESAKTEM